MVDIEISSCMHENMHALRRQQRQGHSMKNARCGATQMKSVCSRMLPYV